jgi:hypothetical protein
LDCSTDVSRSEDMDRERWPRRSGMTMATTVQTMSRQNRRRRRSNEQSSAKLSDRHRAGRRDRVAIVGN